MYSNMITVEHDKLSTNSTLMPDDFHRNQLRAKPLLVLSDRHRVVRLCVHSQSKITRMVFFPVYY